MSSEWDGARAPVVLQPPSNFIQRGRGDLGARFEVDGADARFEIPTLNRPLLIMMSFTEFGFESSFEIFELKTFLFTGFLSS